MSAKTKIVVLHRKKVIYGILIGLSVVLTLFLLAILFSQPQTESDTQQNLSIQTSAPVSTYIPGVYTTELVLGGQTADVEVIVSAETISSIRLTNPSDSLSAMYPLLVPTLETISEQIYETQSLTGITYSADNKYTALVLLEAIRNSLKKAQG